MVSIDGRLKRLEFSQAAPSQGYADPEREKLFDYEGYLAAFEDLWETLSDEQREAVEMSSVGGGAR